MKTRFLFNFQPGSPSRLYSNHRRKKSMSKKLEQHVTNPLTSVTPFAHNYILNTNQGPAADKYVMTTFVQFRFKSVHIILRLLERCADKKACSLFVACSTHGCCSLYHQSLQSSTPEWLLPTVQVLMDFSNFEVYL